MEHYTNFTPDDHCLNLTCSYFILISRDQSILLLFLPVLIFFLAILFSGLYPYYTQDFTQRFNILLTKLLNSDIIYTHYYYASTAYIQIMESYSYTDHKLAVWC